MKSDFFCLETHLPKCSFINITQNTIGIYRTQDLFRSLGLAEKRNLLLSSTKVGYIKFYLRNYYHLRSMANFESVPVNALDAVKLLWITSDYFFFSFHFTSTLLLFS